MDTNRQFHGYSAYILEVFGPTLNSIIALYISLIILFTVVALYLDLIQHQQKINTNSEICYTETPKDKYNIICNRQLKSTTEQCNAMRTYMYCM